MLLICVGEKKLALEVPRPGNGGGAEPVYRFRVALRMQSACNSDAA